MPSKLSPQRNILKIYILCEGRMVRSISRLLGEPTPDTPWRTRSVTVPPLRNRRGLLHGSFVLRSSFLSHSPSFSQFCVSPLATDLSNGVFVRHRVVSL